MCAHTLSVKTFHSRFSSCAVASNLSRVIFGQEETCGYQECSEQIAISICRVLFRQRDRTKTLRRISSCPLPLSLLRTKQSKCLFSLVWMNNSKCCFSRAACSCVLLLAAAALLLLAACWCLLLAACCCCCCCLLLAAACLLAFVLPTVPGCGSSPVQPGGS